METLRDYIYFFLYPKKVFTYFSYKERFSVNNWWGGGTQNRPPNEFQYTDGILASWPLTILAGFKDLVLVFLMITVYQELILEEIPFLESLIGNGEKFLLMTICYIILQIAFYPLTIYLRFIIWGWPIDIVRGASNKSFLDKKVTLIGTLCSHFYLPIPIVGTFLQKVMSFFYYYWGMVHHLTFKKSTAFLVTMIPVFFYVIFYILILKSVFRA